MAGEEADGDTVKRAKSKFSRARVMSGDMLSDGGGGRSKVCTQQLPGTDGRG